MLKASENNAMTIGAAFLILLAVTPAARAANKYWIGPAWGSWNTSSYWSLSGVPQPSDTAYIGVGDQTKVDTAGFCNYLYAYDGGESADFNGDNFVDLIDFAIMRGNFGFGVESAPDADLTATTPEPATLSLLALGGLVMLQRRRRRACK